MTGCVCACPGVCLWVWGACVVKGGVHCERGVCVAKGVCMVKGGMHGERGHMW